MDKISLDSCFLIDLERERKKKVKGPASTFVQHQLAGVHLYISPIALGEFAIGFDNAAHPTLQTIVQELHIFEFHPAVSFQYAHLYRQMRKSTIGSNDLWIAAFAKEAGMGLVTNNTKEFSRIPGLEVVSYS